MGNKYVVMKKAGIRFVVLLVLIVMVNPVIWAQQFPCGTTVTQEQQDYEIALADSVFWITELNRTFHIAVYVTEDNQGQSNIDPADINAAITDLNTAFERIKVTFKLNSITYIDNYRYDEIRMGTNEQDLMTQHATRRVINLYLVLSLYNDAGQEICGFTYYPSASCDAIVMEKDCLNGICLTEQIGHFFNLYHTHETVFGIESVNRTDCKTTGDRVCDTPADPDLTQKVSPDCQYTGNQKDASGTYYFPTTANYMSFSPLNCRCYFSDKQYRRMINCMQKVKQYLW